MVHPIRVEMNDPADDVLCLAQSQFVPLCTQTILTHLLLRAAL